MLKGEAVPPQVKGITLAPRVVALALWWMTRNTTRLTLPSQAGQWTHLFGNPVAGGVVESMCKTNFGRLRKLKLPAWYVRVGTESSITGAVSVDQNLTRFNQVLNQVDPTVPSQVTDAINSQNSLGNELLDFAIELYYLRSAAVMSWRLRDDFDSISLATAVAASANFPPVFPPLVLLGIYDDLHVARLGLSDGGVYDNLGITTLLDEGCSHIIASDTGAPFDEKQRVSSRYVGMFVRLPDVLADDVADQQHTQLRERRRVSAAIGELRWRRPAPSRSQAGIWARRSCVLQHRVGDSAWNRPTRARLRSLRRCEVADRSRLVRRHGNRGTGQHRLLPGGAISSCLFRWLPILAANQPALVYSDGRSLST